MYKVRNLILSLAENVIKAFVAVFKLRLKSKKLKHCTWHAECYIVCILMLIMLLLIMLSGHFCSNTWPRKTRRVI